jgi:predicted amidohydrolase
MNLVAVQAKMERADYRDNASFAARMTGLMDRVGAAVDLSLPTLVAFPELIGMFLSFLPRFWDELKAESSLEAGATKLVMTNIAGVPEECRSSPESAARWLLFLRDAAETEATYCGVFGGLARDFGCYIAAGSIALPPMDAEPSKGGRHVADLSKVRNTAYLFSPAGTCLARTPKANLVPGFEERVFDPAPVSEVLPVQTKLGRIGTLVCFDGFHETLVERYDAMGAQVLLKPSYNQHPWEGPSTYDPASTEGANWLKTGCPSIIQGRENIRYGVNPMLVGGVFDDMYAEGLSSVAMNTGRLGAAWEEGILAIACNPDAEEIVSATVESLA